MFTQPLAPIADSIGVSAAVATLPLLLMFVLLGVFRVKAAVAAVSGLLTALALAVLAWGMPLGQALSAGAAGAFYGLFPILWILVNALWIYKLTLATRWFEVLGRSIRAVSDDLRILAILIGFCFGALLESLAGFGAPVAISAAMLIAAGMAPLKAAMAALLANTAPVAFGALAAPIMALSGVTGIPVQILAEMTGRQTPFMALLVPLLLVVIVDGLRGLRETWPVALVAGIVFGAAQFLTANFFAVELTDVVAAIATVAAVLVMLRLWRPKHVVHAEEAASPAVLSSGGLPGGASAAAGMAGTASGTASGTAAGTASAGAAAQAAAPAATVPAGRPSGREMLMSMTPYLLLVAVFSLIQIPALKQWLAEVGSVTFPWPGLDILTAEGEVPKGQSFHLDHLGSTGTMLLLSGLLTMAVYRIGLRTALEAYRSTVVQLRWTILTVTAVLALSFVMNLSGQTTTLGTALASTGVFFAVLSPVIGWIGVALTGSDTSSNSLFGHLQVTAAEGTGLSPVLMAGANSSAGVLGKMLSLQNLAVASAAVGLQHGEATLFRKLIGWSLGLLAVITVLIVLQSTPVLGWMVPVWP